MFPTYRQSISSNCGLVCIKIIVKYYGKKYPPVFLHRKIKLSNRGCSIYELSELSKSLGFRTNTLNISLNNLEKIELPCIAHWNQNHYIVLYKINKDYIFISDPSLGLVKYNKVEFIKGWSTTGVSNPMGIILEMIPT